MNTVIIAKSNHVLLKARETRQFWVLIYPDGGECHFCTIAQMAAQVVLQDSGYTFLDRGFISPSSGIAKGLEQTSFYPLTESERKVVLSVISSTRRQQYD